MRWKLLLAAMVAALVLTLAAGAVPSNAPVPAAFKATEASAMTGGCAQGRCWLMLNRHETWLYANNRLTPRVPAGAGPLGAVLTASFAVHRWIAKQYHRQGRCVAFIASIRPWENQGMTSYRC